MLIRCVYVQSWRDDLKKKLLTLNYFLVMGEQLIGCEIRCVGLIVARFVLELIDVL